MATTPTPDSAALFLLCTAAGKAAPPRPALPAGKLAGAQWAIRPVTGGTAALAPGETLLAFDGATVGAGHDQTPTVSISMLGVLARVLLSTGATQHSMKKLITAAAAAQLAGDPIPPLTGAEPGDPGTELAVEALIKGIRDDFAATLPKVPRAGAITIRGARFEAAAQSAEGAQPAEGVAQSA
jgi:hypothetical protein